MDVGNREAEGRLRSNPRIARFGARGLGGLRVFLGNQGLHQSHNAFQFAAEDEVRFAKQLFRSRRVEMDRRCTEIRR